MNLEYSIRHNKLAINLTSLHFTKYICLFVIIVLILMENEKQITTIEKNV